jgi:hypothetical protein
MSAAGGATLESERLLPFVESAATRALRKAPEEGMRRSKVRCAG